MHLVGSHTGAVAAAVAGLAAELFVAPGPFGVEGVSAGTAIVAPQVPRSSKTARTRSIPAISDIFWLQTLRALATCGRMLRGRIEVVVGLLL